MRKADRHDILFLQFFAVTSLVLWHAAPHQLENLPQWFDFYVAEFYIGVPLFFFVAGYLWIAGEKKYLNEKTTIILKQKIKRILFPYLFLGTTVFLPKAILNSYTYNPVKPTILGFLSSFLYPATNSVRFLWFLPCLFVLFIIALLFLRHGMNKQTLTLSYGIAILLFLITECFPVKFEQDPLCVITALNNLHFFILGMLAYRYSDYLAMRRISILILIVFHLILFSRLLFPVQGIVLDLLNWAFYSLFIIVIYGLSTRAGKKLMRLSLAYDVGLYSYPIFIFSWFVLVGLRVVLYDRLELSQIMMNGAILLSFIAGLLLPLLLAKYLDQKLPRALRPLVGL